MRLPESRKPDEAASWWPIYVLLAVAMGLLYLERHAALTQTDHTVALLGIVALFVGVVSILLKV